MTVRLDTSHKFATLVKQLHQSPDNPALKQELVRSLPEMKALAKVNPLAQYRLAQIHSPGSPQYKQMMRQSANMGCTNAMLAICEVLVKSNTSADLNTAAHYMELIERSKDSYILKQSRSLLDEHPQLAVLMKTEPYNPIKTANTALRFFNQHQENANPEVEIQNQIALS
jgi:hypothetical protein